MTDPKSIEKQLAKLLAEHHRLNLRVEELEHELESLHNSKSWKLTAWLRSVRSIRGYLGSFFSFGSHLLQLNPFSDLLYKDGRCQVTGPVPYFILSSSKGRLPVGWVSLSLGSSDLDKPIKLVLYYDTGHGFSENQKLDLILPASGSVMLELPLLLRVLRLDVISPKASFSLSDIRAQEVSASRMFCKLFWADLKSQPLGSFKLADRVGFYLGLIKKGGWYAFKQYLFGYLFSEKGSQAAYQKWIKKYESLAEDQSSWSNEESCKLKNKPLLSILMPTYNTPEKWLRKALDSVLAQTYDNWELCVSDDASSRPTVKQLLEEYHLKDQRIKLSFREQNGHISESSNTALQMAKGDFIVLMDHDDQLSCHALQLIAEEITHCPEVNLIYSDEDRISREGKRVDPYHKPDWSPELFLGQNLISHIGVYRTSIAREIGGFRKGYEGSQDWDFALRFVEQIDPATIGHIPKVLYHWRLVPGTVSFTVDTKIEAVDAGKRSIEDALRRRNLPATVKKGELGYRIEYDLSQPKPAVSVVIPLSDSKSIGQLANLFPEAGRLQPFELLFLTEKQSIVDKCLASSEFSEEIKLKTINVSSLASSKALNLAASQAAGDYLCFLDQDLSCQNNDWLAELVSYAQNSEIGAVGGKILNPDNSVRFGGFLLGVCGVVGIAHKNLPASKKGYFGRDCLVQNLSAVSSSCMMLKKELFDQVGAFSEDFESSLYDVDLCLKIRDLGKRIVWNPHVSFRSDLPDFFRPQSSDSERLRAKWEAAIKSDPYYNPNLTVDREDFQLAFPPRQ